VNDPLLSIIVPVVNEAHSMAFLLRDLSRQWAVRFELVIVDGQSTDSTVQQCRQLMRRYALRGIVIVNEPGRARQMNAGVQRANGSYVLFLHADSRLYDRRLLSRALLEFTRLAAGGQPVAGHFPLRFYNYKRYGFAYYFYESKTHTNRFDTINGDQGMLLSVAFFRRLGGFDQSLGYMEDARFARQVFTYGRWVVLPGELFSSARRFEVEGLFTRQLLNAFLCNFDAIGFEPFFAHAGQWYREQNHADKLRLYPLLCFTHALVWKSGIRRALVIWLATGHYVATNTWQLALLLDCRKHIDRFAPGQGRRICVSVYDRWISPLWHSWFGAVCCSAAVIVVFYLLLFFSRPRLRRQRPSMPN